MKDLLQSSKTRTILWILGAAIVVLLVFGAGVLVGYHGAFYVGRFGENYYRNFFGEFPPGRMVNGHGVAGEVIDVASSTLSVRDADGDESSVVIMPATVIRESDQTVALSDVRVGNGVVVIGAPNENGQIEAQFVRIFASSSSLPVPPSSPSPDGQPQPQL
ncbi:MAG: hypothetical protein ABSE18_02470 [Minisyncoccia bacterium]|jgi:hypothetical protein